jgi:lipopolysaccharide export system protein LptC
MAIKPRATQVFPTLLMLGLAAATFYLERLVQLPASEAKGAPAHTPDFIVERFTVQRMNADGHVQSTLTAERMVHFGDDESTELERPRVVQNNPDQPPIQIDADRGTVTKDGEQVTLRDNVVLVRAGTGDRPPARMETSYLEVLPKDEIARTDAPVVIIEGEARLEGVGMEVRAKSRDFDLHSRVRGVYQPQPKPKPAP